MSIKNTKKVNAFSIVRSDVEISGENVTRKKSKYPCLSSGFVLCPIDNVWFTWASALRKGHVL